MVVFDGGSKGHAPMTRLPSCSPGETGRQGQQGSRAYLIINPSNHHLINPNSAKT